MRHGGIGAHRAATLASATNGVISAWNHCHMIALGPGHLGAVSSSREPIVRSPALPRSVERDDQRIDGRAEGCDSVAYVGAENFALRFQHRGILSTGQAGS